MAEQLAQFQDTQPVLQPQAINSTASGKEAFAKVLGQIAGQSMDKATELAGEQSNAGLVQAANQAETIKTDAHIDMIKHPDQAAAISARANENLDALNQNAFVNKGDRLKLKSITADDFNNIRLKAAGVSYSQSQKDLSLQFWDSYPVTMKSIQDALDSNDFQKAKVLEDSFHKAALNAAQMDVISPEQYASIRKSNYELYSRTQDLLKMANNPNIQSAAGYHAAAASPFNNGNFQNTSYPVDGNTQWQASHYNFDRTMSGQYAALYSDAPINWGVVAQGSENDYNNFKMQLMGVNQVRGAVHSGMPFSQIESRMKMLEGKPKLSPMEQGEVNYWKGFKNNLQSGDGYLRMMSQTTMGGQYTQNYNQVDTAIRNSTKTDSEKATAIRDNDNDYIGKMISLGQAQHLDPGFIRPIPVQTIQNVKSAFQKDAPVAPALQSIAYIKPEYRAYIADSMPKSNQAVAVYLSGATFEKADTGFQAQLMEANQDRDYSALLKTGKDETKDSNIWQDISSNSKIVNLMNYFSKMPGGMDVQDGFKKAAVNYVLYRASKEGDININGKGQYIQDFVNNVSKGFDIQQGTRYMFNGANLDIRKADMDYIADYALSEAYRNIHQGRSEADFQSYVDLNPLHATNTPDGRIVVIDKMGHAAVTLDGHAAFDHPYTSNMLNYAHKNASETQKYMHQYFGFTENMQREARLHPGFPFVMDKVKSNTTLADLMNQGGE